MSTRGRERRGRAGQGKARRGEPDLQTADLIGHTAASAQRPPPLRLQTLTQTQTETEMRPCDLQTDDSCACFLLSLFACLLNSLCSVRPCPSLSVCVRLCPYVSVCVFVHLHLRFAVSPVVFLPSLALSFHLDVRIN